jgi:5-methylcytosine-specific restriction endonuclease McrA
MSLLFKLQSFFQDEYPSLSLEGLQQNLESTSRDKQSIEFRIQYSKCTCAHDGALIHRDETPDGNLRIYFSPSTTPSCSYCQQCFAPFPSHWIGAGYSEMDHYHPRLLLNKVEYIIELLEKAIFCKQKQYDSLTNEELRELANETYAYRRYLEKAQTGFHWNDENTPSGLLDEINETEKDIEAIEFEFKARKLM